jgi:DNA sulfur modification protein DndC
MLEAITASLRQLYLTDPRPWMVGFSGGKDSSLVAHLVFDAVRSIPADDRTKEIHFLCTDTRVEIPAVVETIEGTLAKMQAASDEQSLGITTHLLRPPADQTFWVNIIGRGYPPPNRVFRWCTQRMKIDPVNVFVERWLGRNGQAILHLGARRAESASRAQTLADHEVRNGLRKHPDLPRVAVSNPIENLTTEEVWAYLLQNPAPWGGTHKDLYRLYNNAGGGECPIQIDTSTPACGSSRFGCWTCTVVERDKSSEGLLASGDDRMEPLIAFRARLQFYQDPANGKRDRVRMNGTTKENTWGPLLLESRKELLKELLELQKQTGLRLITDDELLLIQQIWRGARGADDGRGVARLVNEHRGIPMNDTRQTARLRKLEATVAEEKGLNAETLQRLVGKVEEYSEMQRAHGLQQDLQRILQDDIRNSGIEPLAFTETSD